MNSHEKDISDQLHISCFFVFSMNQINRGFDRLDKSRSEKILLSELLVQFFEPKDSGIPKIYTSIYIYT